MRGLQAYGMGARPGAGSHDARLASGGGTEGRHGRGAPGPGHGGLGEHDRGRELAASRREMASGTGLRPGGGLGREGKTEQSMRATTKGRCGARTARWWK